MLPICQWVIQLKISLEKCGVSQRRWSRSCRHRRARWRRRARPSWAPSRPAPPAPASSAPPRRRPPTCAIKQPTAYTLLKGDEFHLDPDPTDPFVHYRKHWRQTIIGFLFRVQSQLAYLLILILQIINCELHICRQYDLYDKRKSRLLRKFYRDNTK